jgi:hypothetical protein
MINVNEKPEFEYLDSKKILEEGKLFGYKGKIFAVPEKIMENYDAGIIGNLPFLYDITFDLKEHIPNKDITCEEALEKLQYVGAKLIDASNKEDKKIIKDFQESLVDRNKQGLEKFCSYLTRELNSSDDVTLADEENGLYINSLGQGFTPSKMRKNYCKCAKTIDDVFYK